MQNAAQLRAEVTRHLLAQNQVTAGVDPSAALISVFGLAAQFAVNGKTNEDVADAADTMGRRP